MMSLKKKWFREKRIYSFKMPFRVIRGARGGAWNSMEQIFVQGSDFLPHI